METPEIQLEKGPLPQDLIDEIATYRRLAFMQKDRNLAVYPSTGELIPRDKPISQEDLDEIDAGSLPFKNGEQAVILRGRKKMQEMMESYLTRESSIAAIARNNREMIGIALGCESTLEELSGKEWRHRYSYADKPFGEMPNIQDLELNIKMDEPVSFYSSLIVSSGYQSKGYGTACSLAFFRESMELGNDSVVFETDNYDNLPVISKIPNLFRKTDFLPDSDFCKADYKDVAKVINYYDERFQK